MEIEEVWSDGLRAAAKRLWNLDLAGNLLEPPADTKFGDATTTVALKLAKELRKPPRAIAQELVAELTRSPLPRQSKAEVAGAGYVNLTATPEFVAETIRRMIADGPRYGRSDIGGGERVLIEHCSGNPTGPLHIAHGRQAAVGDTLANIMEFAGWEVGREYYVNDAGNQIEMLGRSIHARLQEALGRAAPFNVDEDKNAYKGEYIKELARELAKTDPQAAQDRCVRFGLERLLGEIKRDLSDFRVRYDVWYSEDALRRSGKVERAIGDLKSRGLTYEKDGALWLRATQLGHDKDDVLLKSDGSPAYRAPDIAYHLDKFGRGFDRVIDFLGPDHHEHALFLERVLRFLGREKFKVLFPQHCRVLRGGQEVKMSKRAASYVTLRELMEEVGVDATRYFFIMRKVNSHLDFDIDVATKRSLDNPVYYSQYAHARISSILARGVEKGLIKKEEVRDGLWRSEFDAARIGQEEVLLLRNARAFRRTVEMAARDLDPALVTDFAYRLSGAFQRYYQNRKNIVLSEDEGLRRARLAVCSAVKSVLRNALALLGVGAPERLESADPEA